MNDIMYVIRSLLEVRAFLSIRVARSSSCFCALAFYWIAPSLPLSSLRYELAFLLLMGRQTYDPDVGGLFLRIKYDLNPLSRVSSLRKTRS